MHKPEFEAKVALTAIKGELTMAEMVKKFDVQAAQITQWKKQLLGSAGVAFDKGDKVTEDNEQTILELRAKCRRLKAEHGIGLVVVDYLQLMHGTSAVRNANREQEIAQISRSLKALAKELNIPVIALSQLSRAVETRGGDKRPQLSDLRESGSIEQDADVVAFIYRAERYGITVDEHGNSTSGLGEIVVGKQRNGPVGNVRLAFIHQYARFENLTTYVPGPADDIGMLDTPEVSESPPQAPPDVPF